MDFAEHRPVENQYATGGGYHDEELVIRSQRGDSEALGLLVELHYGAALRVATAILRNREDAEDEVQNAFAKAFEHIGDFQRGCRFSSWLTRIVVNQSLMRIRQRRRRPVVSIDHPREWETAGLQLRDPAAAPDGELAAREIQAVLAREVTRIPPLLRGPFVLRYIEKLPVADVSLRLGISVAAVKSRLFRARIELQSRLERHQGRTGPATLMA